MKLLVGVDLSESTGKVVETAGALAQALSAQVWLVHIAGPDAPDLYIAGYEPDAVGFDMDPQTLRNSLATRYRDEHRRIQEIAERLRQSGLDVTALLVQGTTVESILEQAAKLEADMIIVGSHGQGAIYQLLVGSVSEGVLRKAECPVLVVPTREHT